MTWLAQVKGEIDWDRTMGLLGALAIVAGVLRWAFFPFWQRVVRSALVTHDAQGNVRHWDYAIQVAEANTDKITMLEAAIQAQGRLLVQMEGMPERLGSVCESMDKLTEAFKEFDRDVRALREWRQYEEGYRNHERRRDDSPPRRGGRRHDDPA
jgi:hypothetical protein